MAYTAPPLSLLSGDKGKPDVGDIKANANIIKRTLANFGITVEMDEITVGPSVTRYALKPAEGVKLSRIVGLQSDLGLALAAHPLRIEAPIPGKSLVGIEVPNSARSTVGLAGLISSTEFKNSEKPLLFTLGKGISGKSIYSDLAKLPSRAHRRRNGFRKVRYDSRHHNFTSLSQFAGKLALHYGGPETGGTHALQ